MLTYIRTGQYFSGAEIQDISNRRTTYNEMVNSGKIYNLSNENLVEQVIEYYRLIDEEIYQVREKIKNIE